MTITKSVTGLGGADLNNSVIGSQAVIVLTTKFAVKCFISSGGTWLFDLQAKKIHDETSN